MKELDMLREMKSVTFSSVENGLPKARIIDVMFIEDDKIYFTTARGKSFYRQLTANPTVAVTGMNKNYESVRVNGMVKKVEHRIIDKIFELNPMMNDLYAGETREILEPFCIYEGTGELFELGTTGFVRKRFAFGGAEAVPVGYSINDNCTACGVCEEVCPDDCINEGEVYSINGTHCIECGRCLENCPSDAIVRQRDF